MDSFKGCLSSREAAEAVATGIRRVNADAEISIFFLADGGEGSLDAIASARGGEIRVTEVRDALLRPVAARWLWIEDKRHAVVEMASAAGLPMLSVRERSAMATSSYGFGLLIRKALEAGASTIDLCLGGSATNDAGLGALQALGLRIIDNSGTEIGSPFCGRMLGEVKAFRAEEMRERLRGVTMRCLRDAVIPFAGEGGAVMLYSAQKGASPAEREVLERGMLNVAKRMKQASGVDPMEVEGAGAAGGTAGGFVALAGAESVAGAEEILGYQHFGRYAREFDMIFTGEGRFDVQTAQGKGPAVVSACAGDIPVVMLAGSVADGSQGEGLFARVIDINAGLTGDPLEKATARRRLSDSVACFLKSKKSISG